MRRAVPENLMTGLVATVAGSVAARLAALACVVGLVAMAIWPASAVGQADDEEVTRPTGLYSVTIGRADVPPDLAGGPALIGQWTLDLDEAGTYEVARQDVGVVASGAYELSGATLTFSDWTGIVCGDAADPAESGASYAWEAAGDRLTLTPIQDRCGERRILLTTRPFGSFAACLTAPLTLPANGGVGDPAGTPVADAFDPNSPVGPPAASPTAGEGMPAGAEVEAAIDDLLLQATACWGTQEPARFLPLHSRGLLAALLAPVPGAPIEAFLDQLRAFMAAPVAFDLIGDVTQVDPETASAYVEIMFDGEPIPQRLTFVNENGAWLFAEVFFLGPLDAAPTPASAP